jgi:putative membrane protein
MRKQKIRFQKIDLRLWRENYFGGIMTPGAIFTIIFGGLLIEYHGMSFWLQMKILLVFFLVLYHLWCGALLQQFKVDANTHGHVWYRIFNEVPVIFLVLIIYLVVYKPI